MPTLPGDHTQLLQRPARARVRCHLDVDRSPCPVPDHNEHVQHPERRRNCYQEARTTIAFVWFSGTWTRAFRHAAAPALRFAVYLPTVRGDTRIPSCSSTAKAPPPDPSAPNPRRPGDHAAIEGFGCFDVRSHHVTPKTNCAGFSDMCIYASRSNDRPQFQMRPARCSLRTISC
jgi:hypothetical protein